MNLINKSPQRIRHETRLRVLKVQAVKHLTPLMLRVTLAGDQLEGFASPGYADHIKIFFAPAGSDQILPVPGPDGLAFPEDRPRPEMRDYTPAPFIRRPIRLMWTLSCTVTARPQAGLPKRRSDKRS